MTPHRIIDLIVGLVFIASSAADVAIASRGGILNGVFYVVGIVMLLIALGPVAKSFHGQP